MDATAPSSSAAQAAKPAADAAKKESSGTQIASDFDQFLHLLTVQLRNQDPLNPVQSDDYAVQLATFSGVEQQVKTNDLLEGIAQGVAGGLNGLAGLVGMEARSAAPAEFVGTPFDVYLPGPVEPGASLIVSNAEGAAIQSLPLEAGMEVVTWAGVSETGAPLPNGTYSFAVKPADEGATLKPAETYAEIVEARLVEGRQILMTPSGGAIDAATVSGLRRPGQD